MYGVSRAVAVASVLLIAACPGQQDVECAEDSDCNLSPGGSCTPAPTGNQWCAYPDPSCASGSRYSDVDVGDDLGGVCTEQQFFRLSVSVGGSASGSVASDPTGLTCDAGTCTADFAVGSQVELSASSPNGAFLGWSDACGGFASCVVTMDADKSVGALFGMPGQALWVQHGGDTGNDEARAIARDTDANLIVAGGFRGTVQLGSFTLTSAGLGDVFVAKLLADTGDVVWAKRFGSTGDDTAVAVAVDDASNVYLTGTFNVSIDFGGGALNSSGNIEAFVAKLDSNGDFGWATKIGGTGFDLGKGIAVRGNAVVAVGSYQQSMTVNGMPFTSVGSDDMYIAMFSTAGALTWIKSFGGTNPEVPCGASIDTASNVVVAGRFSGNSSNLGGTPLASAGFDDVFVAKYAGSTGAHLFSKRFGSTGFDQAQAMAVDASDNIVLMGVYVGTVDFGGPAPLTTSETDLFLVQLSLAGAHRWSKSFGNGSANLLVAGGVVANDAGDVAITGVFCGTTNFGGPPLSSVKNCNEGDRDIFAARLAGADGSHINSIRAGGTGLDLGHSVTQLSDGRMFVAGGFQGFAEFGGEGLTSAGEYDLVVLGLAPL